MRRLPHKSDLICVNLCSSAYHFQTSQPCNQYTTRDENSQAYPVKIAGESFTIHRLPFTIFKSACHAKIAQPIMKTVNDSQKLVENEQSFVGKPLSFLLQNIGPDIKTVMAQSDKTHENDLGGVFSFRFVEPAVYDSCRRKDVSPLAIMVYVKEPFEWIYTSRQKGKERSWTKEDEKKYGNLTVAGIRTYSKN